FQACSRSSSRLTTNNEQGQSHGQPPPVGERQMPQVVERVRWKICDSKDGYCNKPERHSRSDKSDEKDEGLHFQFFVEGPCGSGSQLYTDCGRRSTPNGGRDSRRTTRNQFRLC